MDNVAAAAALLLNSSMQVLDIAVCLHFESQEVFTRAFSAFICSLAEEYDEDEYATVMQQFSADRFLGKRVRFAAFVKAQDVDGWAGLWMRLDGRFGVTLKLDNMQNRPIRGTSERLCDRI